MNNENVTPPAPEVPSPEAPKRRMLSQVPATELLALHRQCREATPEQPEAAKAPTPVTPKGTEGAGDQSPGVANLPWLETLEFYEGPGFPHKEGAYPSVAVNSQDLAHIIAGARMASAENEALTASRAALLEAVAKASKALADLLARAERELADAQDVWEVNNAKITLSQLESPALTQAVREAKGEAK